MYSRLKIYASISFAQKQNTTASHKRCKCADAFFLQHMHTHPFAPLAILPISPSQQPGLLRPAHVCVYTCTCTHTRLHPGLTYPYPLPSSRLLRTAHFAYAYMHVHTHPFAPRDNIPISPSQEQLRREILRRATKDESNRTFRIRVYMHVHTPPFAPFYVQLTRIPFQAAAQEQDTLRVIAGTSFTPHILHMHTHTLALLYS